MQLIETLALRLGLGLDLGKLAQLMKQLMKQKTLKIDQKRVLEKDRTT